MTRIFFVTVRICDNEFKCNYLKTQDLLSNFCCISEFYSQSFKYFEKKVTLIAGVIPKSQTVEAVVTQMSKKSRFRAPCDSQHVNGSQTHVKSSWQHCYHNFSSLWAKVTWKMSLLVIFEILGLFVNTLTTNDKYSFRNSELLP